MQLCIGKLAGAVDGHEQAELAFFCLHFRNVDVEVADGSIDLKLLLDGLALDVR